MNIPDEVAEGVESALEEKLGRPVRLTGSQRVGGGCVSPAARVETDGAGDVFLKWGDEGGIFTAEAFSLARLREADAVRVPEVLGSADGGGDGLGWILLEWLEPGRGGPESWSRLGRRLARLHRATDKQCGWDHDNYIGPLPQANPRNDDWADFWCSERLEPQLRMATDAGRLNRTDRRRTMRLMEDLDDRLGPARDESPSLLHGDLWGGNVHMLSDGEPALIDPAAYYGHREVDLAMSELFGGFAPAFYDAYLAEWPLPDGYPEERRPVYQLYYLLVHVNLFGSGYLSGMRNALNEAGV